MDGTIGISSGIYGRIKMRGSENLLQKTLDNKCRVW